MSIPFRGTRARGPHRTAARVGICDPKPSDRHNDRHPNRRAALRTIAGQVVALPAACLLTGGEEILAATAPAPATALRNLPHGNHGRSSPIIRDFADPVIELIRLLREASEIEHALMLQYLYGAASLRPDYEAIVGYGEANSTDLLGVAIQEMQHLAKVNHFLRALGAAPNLLRQDFPFEPDIYPFAFNLEPLSRTALAKYVYAEAPADALRATGPTADGTDQLVDQLTSILGTEPRANHIGSLYDAVLDTTQELRQSRVETLPDLAPWLEVMQQVKQEGEEDHFAFFKSLFMGAHESFAGRGQVWDLPSDHPDYPARPVPINPSAYVGHHNQIQDSDLLNLAWLSNLHYWSILVLLTLSYQELKQDYLELAKVHMSGPLWSLLLHLPSRGCGVPFDPLSMGYSPGRNEPENVRFLQRLLAESDRLETALSSQLPDDYPTSTARYSLIELAALRT